MKTMKKGVILIFGLQNLQIISKDNRLMLVGHPFQTILFKSKNCQKKKNYFFKWYINKIHNFKGKKNQVDFGLESKANPIVLYIKPFMLFFFFLNKNLYVVNPKNKIIILILAYFIKVVNTVPVHLPISKRQRFIPV